jgi:RNA polymerase-binding protein DksA
VAVTVDIEAVKRRLSEERSVILDERRRLAEDTPRPGEDAVADVAAESHAADRAAETLDRGIELSLEDNAEHLLEAIDSALARVEAGSYGMCERCGRAIAHERLEALPWATKCIECKRLEERG